MPHPHTTRTIGRLAAIAIAAVVTLCSDRTETPNFVSLRVENSHILATLVVAVRSKSGLLMPLTAAV
jgi:hypothetical protein